MADKIFKYSEDWNVLVWKVVVEGVELSQFPNRLNNLRGTSILEWFEVTINADPTKVDISAGVAEIVDNYTDPSNPTYTKVTFAGATAVDPSFLATGPITVFSIDNAGVIQQSATTLSRADSRDKAQFWVAVHLGNTQVEEVLSAVSGVPIDTGLYVNDLADAVGTINNSGNQYSAAWSDLKLQKSAGVICELNINWADNTSNRKDPNSIITSLLDPIDFNYSWRDWAGGWNIASSMTQDIVPGIYDDDSWGASQPGGVTVNGEFTIQRIFYFPETEDTFIQYGQNVYNNISDASNSLVDEDFEINPIFADIVYRGALIVKADATDLSDLESALFVEADRFGQTNVRNAPLSKGVTNLFNFANGSVVDESSQTITSDGATVSFNIERSGGGDLIVQFGWRNFFFDSTPAAAIALTAGSDDVPTQNFVYFTRSWETVILNKNTTGFPLTEHAPLAEVYVQSAASVQTDGPYDHHAWTNEIGNWQGHLDHINFWVRHQPATWLGPTGVDPTTTVVVNGGAIDNVYAATTAGRMLQMHQHAVPVRNMQTWDPARVVNDFTTKFDRITDLSAIDTDSLGNTLRSNNTYYSLVLWINQPENDGDTKLYINAPSWFYTAQQDSIDDPNRYSNYSIPSEFTNTGFLVARIILRYQTVDSGTITEVQTEDLRWLVPATSPGGWSVAAGTTFSDNAFQIYNVADNTKVLEFDASNITTATTRTITMSDGDIDFSWANTDDVLTWNGSSWVPLAISAWASWGDVVTYDSLTDGITADANAQSQAISCFKAIADGANTGQYWYEADMLNTGTWYAYYAKSSRSNGVAAMFYAESGNAITVLSEISIGKNYPRNTTQQWFISNLDTSWAAVWSRSTDWNVFIIRKNATGAFTYTDNFNVAYFKRETIETNAWWSITAQWSVAHFENIVTQTAGTITDSLPVIKLTQDNDSTGGHILFNSYSGSPTTDGTMWFDGTTWWGRAGSTDYDLAASGGLSWGDSISDTSGTGITTTIWANAAASTKAIDLTFDNTQSNASMTLADMNLWSATTINRKAIDITWWGTSWTWYSVWFYCSVAWVTSWTFRNNNIVVRNYNANSTNIGVNWNHATWTGLSLLQSATWWTVFQVNVDANITSAINGIVNYTLHATQSWATVMQKTDLGLSTQDHIWNLVQAYNASDGAVAYKADLGSTGTWTWFFANATVNGWENWALYGGEFGGNYRGSAIEIQPAIAGDVSAAKIEIGRRMGSSNLSMMSDLSIVYSGIGSTTRTLDFCNTAITRTQNSTFTASDNFNLHKFTRTSICTNASWTLTATGSVVSIENIATQTAGTLTDSVVVGKFTQDANSTGVPIQVVQNAVVSTNFKKIMDAAGFTIWVSDGTTAEGALTGVEWDICLNGWTGAWQTAYCDANGTNWTDM